VSIIIDGVTYRIGRDSIYANNIPLSGTDIAMGYVNGKWPSAIEFPGRFPSIPHVTIDVAGTRPDADVLDIENGDATPQSAVSWVREKLAHKGELPVLYVNRSNITAVYNAMHAAGYEVTKHFLVWLATLDGTQRVTDMTGVVAVQYRENVQANYDESIIWDQDWKHAGAPVPSPAMLGTLVSLPGGTAYPVESTDLGITWVARESG
jgi:hypothetical protein